MRMESMALRFALPWILFAGTIPWGVILVFLNDYLSQVGATACLCFCGDLLFFRAMHVLMLV